MRPESELRRGSDPRRESHAWYVQQRRGNRNIAAYSAKKPRMPCNKSALCATLLHGWAPWGAARYSGARHAGPRAGIGPGGSCQTTDKCLTLGVFPREG